MNFRFMSSGKYSILNYNIWYWKWLKLVGLINIDKFLESPVLSVSMSVVPKFTRDQIKPYSLCYTFVNNKSNNVKHL